MKELKIEGLDGVEITPWTGIEHALKMYIATGKYDPNQMVTASTFEKLYDMYKVVPEIHQIQHYIIYNRVYYYLHDIMEFIIRNRKKVPSKFTTIAMDVDALLKAEIAIRLYNAAYLVRRSELQFLFGHNGTIFCPVKIGHDEDFFFGNVPYWGIEKISEYIINHKDYKKVNNKYLLVGGMRTDTTLSPSLHQPELCARFMTILNNPPSATELEERREELRAFIRDNKEAYRFLQKRLG